MTTQTPITDCEPTPAPHTVGSGPGEEGGGESTRAYAHARARLSIPPVPTLVRTLLVSDGPSPWAETVPRCKRRIDYALHGPWTGPNPLNSDGNEQIAGRRWAYLLLYTIPIALPIAVAIDLLDWATHPAGRLAVTCLVLWLVTTLI